MAITRHVMNVNKILSVDGVLLAMLAWRVITKGQQVYTVSPGVMMVKRLGCMRVALIAPITVAMVVLHVPPRLIVGGARILHHALQARILVLWLQTTAFHLTVEGGHGTLTPVVLRICHVPPAPPKCIVAGVMRRIHVTAVIRMDPMVKTFVLRIGNTTVGHVTLLGLLVVSAFGCVTLCCLSYALSFVYEAVSTMRIVDVCGVGTAHLQLVVWLLVPWLVLQ